MAFNYTKYTPSSTLTESRKKMENAVQYTPSERTNSLYGKASTMEYKEGDRSANAYKNASSMTYKEGDRSASAYKTAQSKQNYTPSAKVQQSYNTLTSMQKPADFSYSRQSQMDSALDNYQNRKAYSYDLNGDALYQQYKQQYMNNGKQAMQDAIGQASALTGGYGSSYATSAGSQAYQNSISQLNDVIPQLYQLAYSRYQDEGDTALNKYNMLNTDYSREYGQYRDDVSDYQADRAYNQDMYQYEDASDYGRYESDRNYANSVYQYENAADRSKFESDRDYANSLYQYENSADRSRFESDRDYAANLYDSEANREQSRWSDALDYYQSQYNTDRSFDYSDYQDDLQWQKLLADEELASSSGSSGGSYRYSSSNDSDVPIINSSGLSIDEQLQLANKIANEYSAADAQDYLNMAKANGYMTTAETAAVKDSMRWGATGQKANITSNKTGSTSSTTSGEKQKTNRTKNTGSTTSKTTTNSSGEKKK